MVDQCSLFFSLFYCFSVHHLLPFHLAWNEFNRRLPEIDCLLLQETQFMIMDRVDGKCRTRWQIFEAGFMQVICSRRQILTNSIKVLVKKMRLLYHIVSAMKNGLKNDNVSWHLSSVLKMQNSVKYFWMSACSHLHTHSRRPWLGWPPQQCMSGHPESAASVAQCSHRNLRHPSERSLKTQMGGQTVLMMRKKRKRGRIRWGDTAEV